MKKKNSVRRKFSQEEDDILRDLVSSKKMKNWKDVANNLPNRTARQCRDRWKNYLSASSPNKEWTPEDDNMLIILIRKYGTKYSKIAKCMNGKTDVNIKNRWFKLQRFWNRKGDLKTKFINNPNYGFSSPPFQYQNKMITIGNKINLNTPSPLYFTMNSMNMPGFVQPIQVQNNIIKKNLIESFFNNDKLINNMLTTADSQSVNKENQKCIKNTKKDNKSSSISNINSFKNQDIELFNNKMKQNEEKDDKELDQLQRIFDQNDSSQYEYDFFDLSGDEFNEYI